MADSPRRRDLLKIGTGVALAAVLPACKNDAKAEQVASTTTLPLDTGVVRVASVPTAVEGALLPPLLADFEQASKRKVILTASDGVYDLARAGKVDLAISHYGHKHAEAFVMDGFGEFPRTLFSNQMALIGPPADPATVRGLLDAGEAFRRIAESKSPFLVNGIDGVRYLVEILWNSAGRPDRAGWFVDEGRKKDDAILAASKRGAYTFWGLTPFLRLDRASHLALEPLVVGDPILQRMLVSIVVKGEKIAGVNVEGARALQTHLLSPVTQARIRDVSYPGGAVHWVPAGRHNRTAVLPRG